MDTNSLIPFIPPTTQPKSDGLDNFNSPIEGNDNTGVQTQILLLLYHIKEA